MSRRTDLASKLIDGHSNASAKLRWWPRHSREMGRYSMLATGAKAESAAVESTRQLIMAGSSEWEASIVRSPHPGLMTQHSQLEMQLVDAALRGDIPTMEKIGDTLSENAKRQAEFHSLKIEGFPTEVFNRLMMEHVGYFVDSIQRSMSADLGQYEEAERRRDLNTLALAGFTAEWL